MIYRYFGDNMHAVQNLATHRLKTVLRPSEDSVTMHRRRADLRGESSLGKGCKTVLNHRENYDLVFTPSFEILPAVLAFNP